MRIFLGNGPWSPNGRLGVRAGSRWPWSHKKLSDNDTKPSNVPFPFFLAYCTSYLEKNGHDVLLVDAIASGMSESDFLKKIKKFKPDMVILETSTPSIDWDLKIGRKIKNENKCILAFSGPHTSVLGEDIIKKNKFVDFCFIGEYEDTALKLVNTLKNPENYVKIKGLIFQKDGEIINTGRPDLIDLNLLPWPSRKYTDIYSYSDAIFPGMPTPDVQMWASRGCPFGCVFCLWPKVMYGNLKYRVRDTKDVVDEMEFLVKTYRFKSIYFDDDTFDIGKQRILSICNEIKKRPILKNLKWMVMARADTCDYEMLKAMKDAGLYGIKYGVESGDKQILKNINKKLDLNKVKKTVEMTKKLGIKVHLTFTFGLPGETWKTIEKTISFSHKLNPDSVQFSITTPFPGTKFFEDLDKEGRILTKDWSKYDGALNCVYSLPNLTPEDLQLALKKANDSWKLKIFRKNMPKFIMMGIKNPKQGINYVYDAFKYKLNKSNI